MRPLSVVQVISSPWWTGAAEPALFLTADLSARGHQMHFVCGAGERLEEEAQKVGFPRVEEVEPTRSLNPFRIRRGVEALVAFIERVRADVVHTHLSADHWLSFLATRRVRRHVPVVRSVHHPRAARGNPLYRFLLGTATDAVIAVSHYIGGMLRERSGVPLERLHVVPGGVDLERFHPACAETRMRGRRALGVEADTPLIGIVSRLAPNRGHMTLFDAFQRVAARMPETRLVVVGKGESLPRLKERVSALGLGGRVDFPGYRESDLVEILAAFDVFTLMAPGSEGTCRAVLEAMAMGLPCVVADREGLAELVEEGVTARVVPPEAPRPLAEALLDLLSDEECRIDFGRAGRRRAEECFTRARRAERVEEVYAAVLGAGPAGGERA